MHNEEVMRMAGIYQLIDSALVQEIRLDTVSNNLANINTTAFKKDLVSFDRMLTQETSSTIDLTPGPVRYTGNNLDIALETQGFFKVQTPRGIRYTRDGSFAVNSQGLLVNQRGDAVMGENGPIQVNGGRVKVERNGQITSGNSVAGRISVIDFEKPYLLVKQGGSYYFYQGEEKDIHPVQGVCLRQGYLEGSNVNLTEEMIKLVRTMRVYESAQKAIQCMDEMSNKMVNDIGSMQ